MAERLSKLGTGLQLSNLEDEGWMEASREGLEVAEHGRQQLRYGRMDVHRPLHHCVGGLGVHQIEDRVDDLVAAHAKNRCAQELLAALVDQKLHEALGLALFEGSTDV